MRSIKAEPVSAKSLEPFLIRTAPLHDFSARPFLLSPVGTTVTVNSLRTKILNGKRAGCSNLEGRVESCKNRGSGQCPFSNFSAPHFG